MFKNSGLVDSGGGGEIDAEDIGDVLGCATGGDDFDTVHADADEFIGGLWGDADGLGEGVRSRNFFIIKHLLGGLVLFDIDLPAGEA